MPKVFLECIVGHVWRQVPHKDRVISCTEQAIAFRVSCALAMPYQERYGPAGMKQQRTSSKAVHTQPMPCNFAALKRRRQLILGRFDTI